MISRNLRTYNQNVIQVGLLVGTIGSSSLATFAAFRLMQGPSDPTDWAILVVAPTVGVVLTIIALVRPSWRYPVLAGMLALVVLVIVSELVLAIANVTTLVINRAKEIQLVSPDRRTVTEGIAALRRDGIAAVGLDLSPSLVLANATVPVPVLASPSDRTIVYCNEAGYLLTYRSDEHGFHNPPGLWSGPLDLLMVGDSFVQGACVPPDTNLASLLR